MTEINQDVTLYAGDDKALLFTLTDEAGAALDLTGYTFLFTVRGAGGAVAISKSLGAGIAVVSAVGGTLRVTLGHADTLPLPAFGHPYQLEGTDASGNVSTLAEGVVTVRASVAP